jgi:hypothetical protein
MFKRVKQGLQVYYCQKDFSKRRSLKPLFQLKQNYGDFIESQDLDKIIYSLTGEHHPYLIDRIQADFPINHE